MKSQKKLNDGSIQCLMKLFLPVTMFTTLNFEKNQNQISAQTQSTDRIAVTSN